MKVLVIAPEPFFTPRGTPFSVYYRTVIACELGADVDLLTYGQGKDVDIPGVRLVRIPHFSFLGSVKRGPSLTKVFLDAFMLIWTIALLTRNRYEVVHAHEESVFFCLFLKPIFRFKLVYDMHSSLPEQLSNFRFTDSRLVIRVFEILESMSLRSADAVITICPELGKYAISMMRDPSRHILIENSIFEDVKLVREPQEEGEPQSPVQFPDGRPVIMYAGSFEPYQGLELLIRAFAQVKKVRPDAFLLMVGGTPDQVRHYSDMTSELGLNGHTLFTGTVAPPRVKEYFDQAAVLISPRIGGINTPLKIYEQLASGIPLVATRILSHTQVLDDQISILVEPEAGSMAEGLLSALNDEERRKAVVTAARDFYEQTWSRAAYKEKMQRLFEVLS